jgi:hypothetical protein
MLEIVENSKVVSDRLGHANVLITLGIFSHVPSNLQYYSADNFSNALHKTRSQR